ncbi:50S ribosomal protein L7/L12 [Streptomyces cyaneofuscatus]|uniref:50S ribosomal protein L7/L12 n=1 Tax=Streptomyces cyaneofuscatus TaxID=66883 RepID=UPI0034225E9A
MAVEEEPDAGELIKMLEAKWGVSADSLTAHEAAPTREKTEFDVILAAPGSRRDAVIQAVREITGLDSSAAARLVSNAPATLAEDLSHEEAHNAKRKLEAAGATAETR